MASPDEIKREQIRREQIKREQARRAAEGQSPLEAASGGPGPVMAPIGNAQQAAPDVQSEPLIDRIMKNIPQAGSWGKDVLFNIPGVKAADDYVSSNIGRAPQWEDYKRDLPVADKALQDVVGRPPGQNEQGVIEPGKLANETLKGGVATQALLADLLTRGYATNPADTKKATDYLGGGATTAIGLGEGAMEPSLVPDKKLEFLRRGGKLIYQGGKAIARGVEGGADAAINAYGHGSKASELPGEFGTGFAISSGLSALTAPLTKSWQKRRMQAEQPFKNDAELDIAKRAEYDKIDNSNVFYPASDLRKELYAELKKIPLVKGTDDPAINLIDRLGSDWSGKDMTPAELDSVRRFIRQKVVGSGENAANMERVRSAMVQKLDDYEKGSRVYTKPASGVGPPAPAPKVTDTLAKARDLAARQRRLEDVNKELTDAERTVQSKVLNPFTPSLESQRRTNIAGLEKKVANDTGKIGKSYTPDEIEALQKFYKGGKLRNIGGWAEHLSFSGKLGKGLSALGAVVPGLAPVSLPISGAAEVVHRIGEGATNRRIEELKALIRDPRGKGLKVDPATIEAAKDMLAKMMMGGYRAQRAKSAQGEN